MVAGHLQEKKGLYYIVLNFTDENGKRKPKWIATGLPVKGNKRKAEALLRAEQQKYESGEVKSQLGAEMLLRTICSTGSSPLRAMWMLQHTPDMRAM